MTFQFCGQMTPWLASPTTDTPGEPAFLWRHLERSRMSGWQGRALKITCHYLLVQTLALVSSLHADIRHDPAETTEQSNLFSWEASRTVCIWTLFEMNTPTASISGPVSFFDVSIGINVTLVWSLLSQRRMLSGTVAGGESIPNHPAIKPVKSQWKSWKARAKEQTKQTNSWNLRNFSNCSLTKLSKTSTLMLDVFRL